jgi:hypothetical protein
MMKGATSRRLLIMGAPLALASAAPAQSVSQFVGRWTGHVTGLGDAELRVTTVRPDGQVDGTMVFAEQDKTVSFGEKLDIANGISHALVRGAALTIETALGGTYQLTLANGQLTGEYSRGTTYRAPVTFRKAG